MRASAFLGLLAALAPAAIAARANAQTRDPENVVTIAGRGVGDGLPAPSACFLFQFGIAIQKPSGHLLVMDTQNGRVRQVNAATGIISTYAVTRGGGLVLDADGNAFITIVAQQHIIRIDKSTGQITVYAGRPGVAGDADGPAATATFRFPFGMAFDAGGNLYVAEEQGHRVRRIDKTTLLVSTVAGTGVAGYNGDGIPATQAQLNQAEAVDFDAAGNLYIGDNRNNRIRRVDKATGLISTIAGTGAAGYNGENVLATDAQLDRPFHPLFDAQGNLFFSESHRVRRIDKQTGRITTVAGSGGSGEDGYGGDGGPANAAAAKLSFPTFLAFDLAGRLLISDHANHRVRRVDLATNVITTVAGGSADGLPAVQTTLLFPDGLGFDAGGDLLICDNVNNRLRRVDAATGIIETIAGSGGYWRPDGDDVPATQAQLSRPHGIVVDSAGNKYFPDAFEAEGFSSHRIRKVDAAGTITTIAGADAHGFFGDGGPATEALLWFPSAIALDAAEENLFFADQSNNRVRRIHLESGNITTVVRGLTSPHGGLAIDAAGNLYVSDTSAHCVWRVSKDADDRPIADVGTRIAGTGLVGSSGEGGAATAARLRSPQGLALDLRPDGSVKGLFVQDGGSVGSRVRRVAASPAAPAGDGNIDGDADETITTVAGPPAGTDSVGFSGDGGLATSARFNGSGGLGIDAAGNLVIGDNSNYRVRRLQVAAGLTVDLVAAPGKITAFLEFAGPEHTAADVNPATAKLEEIDPATGAPLASQAHDVLENLGVADRDGDGRSEIGLTFEACEGAAIRISGCFTDGRFFSGDQVVVTHDTTPPVVTILSSSEDRLWPPDHTVRDCLIAVSAVDCCDDTVTLEVTAQSSEPDDDPSGGDGATVGDIDLDPTSDTADTSLTIPVGPSTGGSAWIPILLRSERLGNGARDPLSGRFVGRNYTLTFTATDASGNISAAKTVVVNVPH